MNEQTEKIREPLTVVREKVLSIRPHALKQITFAHEDVSFVMDIS